MASEPLVDTYKRYKTGTAKLVTWLSESAQLCDKSVRVATKQSQSRKVSTDDLVGLAQRIVNSKDPVIEIALDILDITKDAITGRSQAARWYASLAEDSGDAADSSLHKANTSHQYFLAILKEVFEILRKEHKVRRPKRKKQMPVLASDTNDLTNLYQHLQLEETATNSSDAPIERPQKTVKTSRKAAETNTYDLDNEQEEKHFQIWCLLKDLFSVRLYTRSVLSLYNKGSISYIAACKMAENAMTMSYSLSETFGTMHPDLDSFDKIVDFIGARSFYFQALRKHIRYDLNHTRGEDHEEPSEDNWADLLCMHAWRSLSDFREVQSYVWMSQLDRQKIFKGKKPVLNMEGHPFSKVLVNISFDIKAAFPELTRWVRDKTGTVPRPSILYDLDDYTGCLLHFSQSRNMETGHVAATQLYLEMYDALDGDLARGLREFGGLINAAENSRLRVTENEQEMEELRQWVPFCVTGENEAGVSGWFVPSSSPTEMGKLRLFIPNDLLSTMPMLAGHHAYLTLYRHQQANLAQPFVFNEIASATYLYKAAEISGSLHKPWTDMEFFMARQAFLLGSTWKDEMSMRSLVNKFGMSLGLSIQQVSKGKEPTLPRSTQVMKSLAPASACRYMDAYWGAMDDGSRFGLEVDLRMFYKMVKTYASSETGIQDKVIADQWKETRRLSPVQLLQVAQEILIEDDPYLHFDYYEFSQRCIELLQHASTFFLARKLPATRTHPLSYGVVHAILWEAAMAEMRGISAERTSLHRVGKLVSALTEADDSHCRTRALELSSGHLPDHRKPSVLHPNQPAHVDIQDMSHINYAEGPPAGQAEDPEWYAKIVHPDEEKFVRWGYEALTEAMEVQGLDVETAAKHVEGIMVEHYRSSSVTKRPVIQVDNGVAVITTRAWTWEEISENVALMDPKQKELIMRLGVSYM